MEDKVLQFIKTEQQGRYNDLKQLGESEQEANKHLREIKNKQFELAGEYNAYVKISKYIEDLSVKERNKILNSNLDDNLYSTENEEKQE